MYNLSLLNFQICDVFITGFFYHLNEKKKTIAISSYGYVFWQLREIQIVKMF